MHVNWLKSISLHYCTPGERFSAATDVQSYLSKIWGSHGGKYKAGCLLGCSAVWSGRSKLLPDDMVLQPRRQLFSKLPQFTVTFKPRILSSTQTTLCENRHPKVQVEPFALNQTYSFPGYNNKIYLKTLLCEIPAHICIMSGCNFKDRRPRVW
jgi:hypothetical protein